MSDLGTQLITEVRRLAADNPLFMYQPPTEFGSCKYIHNGCGDCLVGQAMLNIGLINLDWDGDSRSNSDIASIIKYEGWLIDEDEVQWLYKVQQAQDSRAPWGRCIRHADDS